MVQVNESGNLRYTLEKVYLSGAPPPATSARWRPAAAPAARRGSASAPATVTRSTASRAVSSVRVAAGTLIVCPGEASEACGFDDYVFGAPGCEILTGTPTCAGTPERCELQPECAAEGCGVAAACEGGRALVHVHGQRRPRLRVRVRRLRRALSTASPSPRPRSAGVRA